MLEDVVESEDVISLLGRISDWSLSAEPGGQVIAYPLLPDELDRCIVESLRRAVVEEARTAVSPEFRLIYKGMSFRVRKEITQSGTMYFLRRFGKPDRLRSSRVPESIVLQLISNKLNKGGLVLVSGVTGAGKTSTAVSTLVSRLLLFGGVAWTIEDPMEFKLEGRYGRRGGVCWQKNVEQGSFGQAMRDVMRCYPAGENGILFVGEVRDAETAQECLKAASNGLLVVATIHAGSITGTLDRILALASPGSNTSLILATLASHLRLVVHQERSTNPRAPISFESLWVPPDSNCTAAIRDGDFQSIRNDISFQANRRKSGKPVC